MWIAERLDQPVGAYFVVALLIPEVAFFPLALLLVREAAVALFVLPRVVRVVVAFAAVDDLPFLTGLWERSEVSSVFVAFLRVLLRAEAQFCSGLSTATPC